MKFSELVEQLGDGARNNSLPDSNPDIIDVAPVDNAAPNTISFIEGANKTLKIEQTSAGALILPPSLIVAASDRAISWIATPEPRLLFAKAIALFYHPFHPHPEIHPTAVIHPDTKIGKNVYIGAHVTIQGGVKLGDDVCLHPHVVIYPGVEIGNRTIIHANCTIQERSQIGADCVIHSGAVIGSEGFGFVPTPEGWFKMEQSGFTVLENGVEVGCNSAIDRPAVGETRIGRNTKIDNLVQIGHGCQVGENCAISGQVGLAGGVKLGNNVILAGQVGIANQIKMGDGAIASAKTGVSRDIKPGETVSGYPCVPHKIYLKSSAIYKRLPEIYQTLTWLKKRLNGER